MKWHVHKQGDNELDNTTPDFMIHFDEDYPTALSLTHTQPLLPPF